MTGVVGVLGAAGAVGTATARALGAAGVRVRPGVRPAVDAGDPASLARFCAGCRVVVNATGAGERERVASAALAAGAHYVDPTGDAALVDRAKGATWTALLAAGATPGLSGLLPRWLASQGFDRASVLTAYAAAFDGFTPGAAAEFLLSLDGGDGEAGADHHAGDVDVRRQVVRVAVERHSVVLGAGPRPGAAPGQDPGQLERHPRPAQRGQVDAAEPGAADDDARPPAGPVRHTAPCSTSA